MAEIVEKDDENGFGLLFKDDAGLSDDGREIDGPTLVDEQYVRKLPGAVPSSLDLSLVSSRHSLWGHRLWNAALVLAEMMDGGEIPVEGKTVLELGAGAGLPGLICALNGARKVVISDYATSTDQSLMVPIEMNIDRLQPTFVTPGTLHAKGHVWGHCVGDLLAPLQLKQQRRGIEKKDATLAATTIAASEIVSNKADISESSARRRETGGGRGGGMAEEGFMEEAVCSSVAKKDERINLPNGREEGLIGFDIVIMADLLFNRSQHTQLLETCDQCLKRPSSSLSSSVSSSLGSDSESHRGSHGAEVWVSFSHHDPEKTELDMKFFGLARAKGFVARHFKTVQRRDLFVENDGLDELRGAVHLWRLTRDLSMHTPSIRRPSGADDDQSSTIVPE